MRRHSGKIAAAAVELGVSRPTLYELMEKLGVHSLAEAVSLAERLGILALPDTGKNNDAL